jgi:hypothetical protein
MMSPPVAIPLLIGLVILFWLEARTLLREVRTGVPHLFFSPHPAYRGREGNRRSLFLWFTVACRVFGTLVLGFMVFVAVLYLLESLGVIYQ